MNAKKIFEIFSFLKNDKLSFIYKGQFSDAITDYIIGLNEHHINASEEMNKLRKKISFIIVESFQNLVRHKDELSNDNINYQLFFSRQVDNCFCIASSNIILKNKIALLSSMLEQINGLEPDELKNLYKEILAGQFFSEKGGAGIGLIEMARKSGDKIDYQFIQHTEKKSWFNMQVNIHNVVMDTIIKSKHSVSEMEVIKKFLIFSDSMLVFRGNFNQASIIPLLKMIENIKSDEAVLGIYQTIINSAIELLQNISKHSCQERNVKDGIFMVGTYEGKYILASGNYIEKENAKFLKGRFTLLKDTSQEQLNKLYDDLLWDSETSPDGNAGIGLVDIFRQKNVLTDICFSPINNNICFVSILISFKKE